MKRARDSKLRQLRLRRTRRITAGLVHHHAPAWSADARLLASRLGEGADSYWVIVDRKGRIARVLEGPTGGAASFSPDGSLAYSRQVGATSEIWLLPPLGAGASGGATPRRLLGGDGRLYRDPAYSPDGRFLCYVADDGQAGVGLRLWLLDLLHDDHKVLVPWLPAVGEAGSAARISHPAWAKAGDRLYFEATSGESSAIYSVAAGVERVERLTEAGYRRPAPLAPGLLLCERAPVQAQKGGESELVIVDHRQPNRPDLTVLAAGAREPAVVWRKKAALLAWAMPCRTAPDEPSRFDLHVARLIGVPASPLPGSRRSLRDSDSSEADSATDATGTDARHGAADLDDAAQWLERPLPLSGLFNQFERGGEEAGRP
jgi:Tol biopolymer transport system component